MKSSNGKKLPTDSVVRLYEIFHSKNWHSNDEFPSSGGKLFERFCRLLERLEVDEQDLILTLTEDFLKYWELHYPILMEKALARVPIAYLQKFRKIYLLPIVASKDLEIGSGKSGHHLLYSTEHIVFARNDRYATIRNKVAQIANIEALGESLSGRADCLIMFLDDFIGTGKTTIDCLFDYWTKYRVSTDEVVVVALVAQRQGLVCLDRHYFKAYAGMVRKRGISDSQRLPDIEKALSIMDRIEKRAFSSRKYYRGFGQCEALVSMIRTPNDTFPVYWMTRGRHGQPWPAPFGRYM